MKSNKRADALAVVVAVLALLGMSVLRPRLAEKFQGVKNASEAYLLPAPDQTYVASLGYRSALADLIWGHVLVSYGIHMQEHREFALVGDYLDAINRLDPKFRTPYALADTLLTLQVKAVPLAAYRKARQIQERGLAELPYDQELWSTAGQFIAYLAPGQLTDQAEKDEYQRAGAGYLMHACDLIGSNENLPYQCVVAANLLTRQGNRDAARNFLERVLTISDDPGLAELAGGYLRRLYGEEAQAQAMAHQDRFRAAWSADLPGSLRAEVASLAPRFDAAKCAGLAAKPDPACATSWRAWAADDATNAAHATP